MKLLSHPNIIQLHDVICIKDKVTRQTLSSLRQSVSQLINPPINQKL